MTDQIDISREAVAFEVNGLRFLHNSTCKETRLPPKEWVTAHSRAATMILALRAALDAAEAEKARAVEAERAAFAEAVTTLCDPALATEIAFATSAIRTEAKP